MILQHLKTSFSLVEPVIRETVHQMDARFRLYADIRLRFFEGLPTHLLQSELVSFVNKDIKQQLFSESFCESIQDALKTIRRAIIRLEDLREANPGFPTKAVDLNQFISLAEEVESLYQKHWEYYRYQSRMSEEDLVRILMDIDRIGYHWDLFLGRFSAVLDLANELEGAKIAGDTALLRISYQRPQPHQFSVNTLTQVAGFLECAYRFVCSVSGVDASTHPLALVQVEVADPVDIQLAVPLTAEALFRRFLQYLFLHDMLKREALLKVVFEAIGKDSGNEKALPTALVTTFTKELTTHLKNLPSDGRFTVSDRTFPDDRIEVLQEFTANLDGMNISYEKLLADGKPAKKSSPTRDSSPAKPANESISVPIPVRVEEPLVKTTSVSGSDNRAETAPLSGPSESIKRASPDQGDVVFPASTFSKGHISLLTEKKNR